MAADAYLKAAAGQLQQAASAVKQSAEHIRAEAASQRRQLERDITSLQTDLTVRQMEFDRSKDDPARASGIQVQIRKTSQELDAKKQQLSQLTSQAEQAVRAKEGTSQKLASQASGLAQQSGDPNLR